MTENEAIAESWKIARSVMHNVTCEFKMAQALRAAMIEFGHECDIVTSSLDSFQRENRWTLVAQCVHCGQLLTAYANPFPKPLLFGRKAWKEVILEGGANRLHCGFASRQVQAVAQARVKGVMET